jgi:predicted DNA-binding transcriptional regulator
MTENRKMTLNFGAISPKIEDQLKDQGLKIRNVAMYQSLADSIVKLKIHEIITKSMVDKAIKRLFKEIEKEVEIL